MNIDTKPTNDKSFCQQIYLFVFVDDSIYEMNSGISLKDAIWEMSKYTGTSYELFRKSLNGFDDDDIDGIVNLYNHFSGWNSELKTVYTIKDVLYSNNKKE